MKLTSFILLINLLLFSKEISVFSAGDLESSNPYGLTSSEKVILKNKNKLTKFDRKIDDTRFNIEQIKERIDGIESVIDGDSIKLNVVSKELKYLSTQYNLAQISFLEFKALQKQNIRSLKDDIDKIKKDIFNLNETLKKLVEQINKDYINKQEFNKLVIFINKQFKKQKNKKIKKIKYNKSKRELIEEGRVLFKKDYFSKAIPLFKYLIKEKYKPAESSFYLGEIWFYRKQYKDAIYYFKNSMLLYDKAKYIPKLLLHSAISFEKTNDLDNAVNFYGTLVDVYPNTQEAKEAKLNLAKITQ
jgi:TolA-binding protein